MTRPTILFAPETFNIAETTRAIEIAKACREHFTAHFMGYGGDFVHLIEEAGFTFHLLEPHYTQAKIEHLWKIDRMEAWGEPFTLEEVRQRVQNELALYEQLQPRVVVIGFTLTVYLSARIARIPLVAVAPLAFTRPFVEAGLATFPDQFKWGVLKYVPAQWLDKAVTWWTLRTKAWTKNFNIVMQEYGLPPFKTLLQAWEADHMLIAESPDIGKVDLPQGWRYVGAIFAHLPGDVPQDVEAFARNRPLIYCAMGSSGNEQVVKRIIEAFDGTPYHVVAPVKFHLDRIDVRVPDNVMVTDWLPAPKVNAMADIAVIHGGQGTVQTACASGTPFVGIGMQAEQEANIDFLVRRGCAIRIGRKEVNREKLLTAIEKLLHDEEARRIARDVQASYATWDGAKRSADFLREHFS